MQSRILPRLIRLRDAPHYLGMDPNRFNAEVRPYLTEIPIGKQGIGFDRLDLDAWFEDYKSRNGRPGKRKGVDKPWDARKSLVSINRKGIWHIDKIVRGRRICESTGDERPRRSGRILSPENGAD